MPILKRGEMGIAVLYVKIFQEMEVIKLLPVWNVTSGVTVISHLPPLARKILQDLIAEQFCKDIN